MIGVRVNFYIRVIFLLDFSHETSYLNKSTKNLKSEKSVGLADSDKLALK